MTIVGTMLLLLMLFALCILQVHGLSEFAPLEDDREDQPTSKSTNQVISGDSDKKKIGEYIVKKTLKLGRSDSCDWRTNPLAGIRGHLCGTHYKVLGLNRKTDFIDKNVVRKAYRQMSLVIHPDKNPSAEADDAFQLIQEAYECLSDDVCRGRYDVTIDAKEQQLKIRRMEIKRTIVENMRKVAVVTYHHIWNAARRIHHGMLQLWDWTGDITINIADIEVPIGRGAVMLSSFTRLGRAVFFVHLISLVLMKLDEEGNRFVIV